MARLAAKSTFDPLWGTAYNRRMVLRVRGLIVIAVVTLAGLLGALGIAHAANLLNNGGFNGAFVAQPGINGTVPAGWTAFNQFGNPQWTDSASLCNCGGNNEKTEGTNAVVVVSENQERNPNPGRPFTAVLSQSVSGVLSGTAYSLAAAMLTFCGGTADGGGCATRNYTMAKSVGIDPSGGTLPTAPTVIWSPENGDDHGWRDMTTAARAVSTTLTMFMKVRWPYQYHGAFTFWDAAYLAQAPTATLKANAPVSTGSITLTWSGRMPQDISQNYPGIALGFDVQVLDPAIPGWHNLLTGTQQSSLVFAGTPGNTYQFRVLPFMGYLPDNHRFEGLTTNPISVTVGDFTPPTSSVGLLPPVQYTNTFAVAWSGSDNISPPAALVYDIQVRDGAAGAWTPWLTATAATTAQYSGQTGHTYYFRSRAHDQAGNVETYAANPQAATSVALSISGTVYNLRGQPVSFASASLTPSAVSGASADLNGQYTLWITASNTYALNAARDGFGLLPPVGNIAANNGNIGNIDAVLPPLVDLVANGQFESGNLGGWTSSVSAAPAVTTTAHSGSFAAALGGAAGVESTVQQTLFLSPTLSLPTLSYLYRAAVGAGDLFTVTVSGDSGVSVSTPSVPSSPWTHRWLDLTPFAGQNIIVTFAFQPAVTPDKLLLDEVAIGNASAVGVNKVYLPMVIR
jgi:hypothetical protein